MQLLWEAEDGITHLQLLREGEHGITPCSCCGKLRTVSRTCSCCGKVSTVSTLLQLLREDEDGIHALAHGSTHRTTTLYNIINCVLSLMNIEV